MNYHFDHITLPQLEHLLKGGKIFIDSVCMTEKDDTCQLKIQRKAEPNAGMYSIVIRHCTDIKIQSESDMGTDIVIAMVYEANRKSLIFRCKESTLSCFFSKAQVSAIAHSNR